MSLVDDLQKRVSELEKELKESTRKRFDSIEKGINGIRGNPLIQGYNGMRLTLNESLNVLQLKKEISDLTTSVLNAAKTYTDAGTADIAGILTDIAAIQSDLSDLQADLAAIFTGLTTNAVVKFDGTDFSNSSISDNGSLVTISAILAPAGYRAKSTRTTSTPFAITTSHETIWFDTDSNAIVANLPAGVSGTRLKLINCGSSGNNVTVTPNGTEKIDGVNAAKTLSDGGVLDLEYETTEGWR